VSNVWSTHTTWDEVCQRAGGRRHFNHWRQLCQLLRRLKVSWLLRRYRLFRRGTVTAIARELGVQPCTVSRDIRALLRLARPCPHCGALPVIGPEPEGWDTDLFEEIGP
jgi:hypothetical protein